VKGFLVKMLVAATSIFLMLFFVKTCLSPSGETNLGELPFSVEIFDANAQKIISEEEFFSQLKKANVVYVLEKHDNYNHHLLQAKIAEYLGRGNGDFAIGFEMFDKIGKDQQYLDLYRKGEISESEFINSAWHWGFDFKLYKDILDLVGLKHYQAVGLNIPFWLTKEFSKKITANGFEALPKEGKALFPKDGFKILCDEGKYHNAIMAGLEAMRQMGIATAEMEKRFHTSQWVMNEIMAASILNYFENKNLKKAKMVVVIGGLHPLYNQGIVVSVGHRNPELKQITVLPINYDEAADEALSDGLADFLIFYRN
jgi:uncharacterized iron-regulated protein